MPKYTLAVVALIPVVVLAIVVPDPYPWLLLYLSYCLPLPSRNFRSRPGLLLSYWIVLSVHHGLSIANIFTPLLYIGNDADSFHALGVRVAEGTINLFGPGKTAYAWLLGTFYKLGSPSVLLGQELAVLAWGGSAILLIRLAIELDIRRYLPAIMLLYGLEPYSLVLTSQVMRESWQLLALIGSILASVWCLKQLRILPVLMLLACLVLFSLLHNAMALYTIPYAIVFFVVLLFNSSGKIGWTVITVIFLSVILSIIAVRQAVVYETTDIRKYRSLYSGQVIIPIKKHRDLIKGYDARTQYEVDVPLEEIRDLPLFSVVAWWKYHTSPVGMKLQKWKDYYAFMKSLLRSILLPTLFLLVLFDHTRRAYWFILLYAYFGLNFLWAIGTTNFGQALRHHATSEWILILSTMRSLGFVLRSRRLAGRQGQ